MRIILSDLEGRIAEPFRRAGCAEEEASRIAQEIAYAEVTGRLSHGLSMVPKLMKRVRDFPMAEVKVEGEGSSWALLSYEGGPGPVAAWEGMDMAVNKALKTGVAMVGVKSPSPFLTAGFHVRRVVQKHPVVAVAVSVAKAKVAPFGAGRAILGTNPIGFAFPAEPAPIVIDLATTGIAAADVRDLEEKEGELPTGVAIDSDGRLTTNPKDALRGALLSFGGYKGSSVGLMVELLSGALLGIKAGLRHGSLRGMLFGVVKADLFESLDSVVRRASDIRSDINESPSIKGSRPRTPGDRSSERLTEAASRGVEVADERLFVLESV